MAPKPRPAPRPRTLSICTKFRADQSTAHPKPRPTPRPVGRSLQISSPGWSIGRTSADIST